MTRPQRITPAMARVLAFLRRDPRRSYILRTVPHCVAKAQGSAESLPVHSRTFEALRDRRWLVRTHQEITEGVYRERWVWCGDVATRAGGRT